MDKKQIVEMEGYLVSAIEKPSTVGGHIGKYLLEQLEMLSSSIEHPTKDGLLIGVYLALEHFQTERKHKMVTLLWGDFKANGDAVYQARKKAGQVF